MTPCTVCTRPTHSGRAMVLNGVYHRHVCDNCASGSSRNPDSSAAQFHRQRDLEDHRADVLQSHAAGKPNLEFARTYPDMWDRHYTEEEIKEIRREL